MKYSGLHWAGEEETRWVLQKICSVIARELRTMDWEVKIKNPATSQGVERSQVPEVWVFSGVIFS